MKQIDFFGCSFTESPMWEMNPKLGVITMDIMAPHRGEVPEEFLDALEKEAKKLGIDPDELDIRPDNFMEDPSTGKIKMTDV